MHPIADKNPPDAQSKAAAKIEHQTLLDQFSKVQIHLKTVQKELKLATLKGRKRLGDDFPPTNSKKQKAVSDHHSD